MEKSKFLFNVAGGFGYRSEVITFSKGLEITYQSIFLSAWSDNIKSVKKNKEKCGKIESFVFRRHVWISVKKYGKMENNFFHCLYRNYSLTSSSYHYKIKEKKYAWVRGYLKPLPSYMVFEAILWVGRFWKSSLCWRSFEANVDLAGFRWKCRRNFEEMQLIYKFNK